MASPIIAKELQKSIKAAFELAAKLHHPYVTVEHLVASLMDDTTVRGALDSFKSSPDKLKDTLLTFLSEQIEQINDETQANPQQTLAVERVLHRAAIHALNSESPMIDGARVLIEVFDEVESYAVYVLKQAGITALSLKEYVSHLAPSHALSSKHSKQDEPGLDDDEPAQDHDPLAEFTTNLVEEAAAGRIDPLIGRDKEVERAIYILARRRKNNPLFVGDPGVGKTALAEGLALRIYEGKVPQHLRSAIIYSLDMGALLAGTKFRGQFEERLKGVIKALQEQQNAIVFIDEIHTIVGAGMTSCGSMDASNIQKPALASGKLRCIGSTTHSDFKASFDHDRALSRRFQRIDVKEPSVDETVQILKGLKARYESHHHVRYENRALEAAAKLSQKFLRDLRLPDKAIDVMDEAGVIGQLKVGRKSTPKVTVKDIEAVVSRMAGVPAQSVSVSDRDHLKHLGDKLREVIFGQNEAVERIVSAIKLSRAGLRDPDKPVGSFLFSGPTGVGKTELAKQLAKAMGVEFLRFDMSEYSEKHTVSRLIGAPPGYVGFEQGGMLTDGVRQNPSCVVVLDEIEKAHPDLYNVLLQIMDHATLTDNTGRQADFRNVVLIMTTNAGAFEMSTRDIGFGSAADGVNVDRAKNAIERTFSPEFRNRLDAWVRFDALGKDTVLRIVDKEVALLSAMLKEKGLTLSISDEARQWFAEHGYDQAMGARPMARLVEEKLKRPLAETLLFENTTNASKLHIKVKNNDIDLQLENSHSKK
ncbi:MAG: ATP-dependent Clp protease ATP-binding subunit ClpA [Myxococcales bacterium]|nr:MAG: ATP-dependent Clp protease ATP-binding subunit ClpA [Myxococcales bacterium]